MKSNTLNKDTSPATSSSYRLDGVNGKDASVVLRPMQKHLIDSNLNEPEAKSVVWVDTFDGLNWVHIGAVAKVGKEWWAFNRTPAGTLKCNLFAYDTRRDAAMALGRGFHNDAYPYPRKRETKPATPTKNVNAAYDLDVKAESLASQWVLGNRNTVLAALVEDTNPMYVAALAAAVARYLSNEQDRCADFCSTVACRAFKA